VNTIKIDLAFSNNNNNNNSLQKQGIENKILLEIKNKLFELENQIYRNGNNSDNAKSDLSKVEQILDKIILKLTTSIRDLNKIIVDSKSENNYKLFYEKVSKLENEIANKNKEIENLEEVLEQRDMQIKIDKEDLERTILHKDYTILKIMSDLESKVKLINEQKELIENITSNPNQDEASVKIVETVKNCMQYKGFITEKELEEIKNKIYKPTKIYQ